jgi:hypothetical protein
MVLKSILPHEGDCRRDALLGVREVSTCLARDRVLHPRWYQDQIPGTHLDTRYRERILGTIAYCQATVAAGDSEEHETVIFSLEVRLLLRSYDVARRSEERIAQDRPLVWHPAQ